MNINNLKQKLLWQMTGEEFLLLQENSKESTAPIAKEESSKRFVYGLSGLADLFGCSIPTANRIKKSGKIELAITQIGRKIIVDAELALKLAGRQNGGRRQL